MEVVAEKVAELRVALRLAEDVVAAQADNELYLYRQAVQRGDYVPAPGETMTSAATKALDAIRAALVNL